MDEDVWMHLALVLNDLSTTFTPPHHHDLVHSKALGGNKAHASTITTGRRAVRWGCGWDYWDGIRKSGRNVCRVSGLLGGGSQSDRSTYIQCLSLDSHPREEGRLKSIAINIPLNRIRIRSIANVQR